MKILVLNAFELSAATTIRMEQLCKVLGKRHNIIFVSYNDKGGRFAKNNIRYILFKRRLSGPFLHFRQSWLKFLAAMGNDYDILYVSKPLPWALFPALVARALRGKKILLDWDEHEHAIISRVSKNKAYLWIMGMIEKYGVKNADGLVVVSPYLKKLALRWGYDKGKIRIVQNGVDPKRFRPVIKPAEMRKRFNLLGKTVMFIGSLRPQFDIDLVLRAMPFVKQKVKDVNLVIVGGGSERQNLEKLAANLGIDNITMFLGQQPYEMIPSFVKMADVVVAPNRFNDMNRSRSPVKIAEYMSVGAPIVANSVGLAAEMLKGGAGELVQTESPKEMADKIIRMLTSKKERDLISRKAVLRVKRDYTWEKLGSDLSLFIDYLF